MEENRKKVPFYNQIEKYMIVSMFLVMTVIIALNVVTRFVFNFTLSWGEQLARLLLVWTSFAGIDRKSTRLNSSHCVTSRMPSSA